MVYRAFRNPSRRNKEELLLLLAFYFGPAAYFDENIGFNLENLSSFAERLSESETLEKRFQNIIRILNAKEHRKSIVGDLLAGVANDIGNGEYIIIPENEEFSHACEKIQSIYRFEVLKILYYYNVLINYNADTTTLIEYYSANYKAESDLTVEMEETPDLGEISLNDLLDMKLRLLDTIFYTSYEALTKLITDPKFEERLYALAPFLDVLLSKDTDITELILTDLTERKILNFCRRYLLLK